MFTLMGSFKLPLIFQFYFCMPHPTSLSCKYNITIACMNFATQFASNQIPNLFSSLQNSSADWGYQIDKSKKAGRASATSAIWPRGKFIGGSGAMSGMLYVRGNARDYDNWDQLGNPSWGWHNNVSEYFRKSEDIQVEGLPQNDSNYGVGGPLKVNWFQNEEPFKRLLFSAAQELGYKQMLDINGNEHVGLGIAPAILDHGISSSPAKAYLGPAKDRANLHVIKHAFVTKVNVDNSTGQVTGVDFTINHTDKFSVISKKEVVLSAGSIGTPHILLLSGIGPDKYTRRLNMPTIRDLKVGFSLQDHVYAPIFLKFNQSNAVTAPPPDSTDDLYNYIKHKKGANRIFDVVGFFNTVNVTDAYPNIGTQYVVFKRGEISILTDFLSKIGYNDSIAQPILEANNAADTAVVLVILLNPQSLGKIRLNSTDPFVAPRIQPNHLDHREDMATLVQGIQLTRTFYNTAAFMQHEVSEINMNLADCVHGRPPKVKTPKPTKAAKPLKKQHKKKDKGKHAPVEEIAAPVVVDPPVAPEPPPIAYGSNEYWECYIRQLATSLHHPVGTAKMGPATDPFAVVDARLNVHGLKGIRVIDSSIMPKIVSGNTAAASVMIAEKGSDFIREDWQNQPAEPIAQPVTNAKNEL